MFKAIYLNLFDIPASCRQEPYATQIKGVGFGKSPKVALQRAKESYSSNVVHRLQPPTAVEVLNFVEITKGIRVIKSEWK